MFDKKKKTNLSGVKPYIEAPEVLIKKAIRKTALLVILFFLITAGGVFFASKKISAIASELQNKQNLIFLAHQQTAINNDLLGRWQGVSQNVDKISNSVPSSNDLLGFLGEIEKIAEDTGVSQNVKLNAQPTSNNTGKTTNASKGSSVDYTIELKGTLGQMVDFMSELEKAPYFTKTTNFNITSVGNFGMKIFTYN